MAFLTQSYSSLKDIRLSFCAQNSEKHGKNCCHLAFKIECKEKILLCGVVMLDKIDRKLLGLLQQDCTLSLQALADAVNLTTTPAGNVSNDLRMTVFCWAELLCWIRKAGAGTYRVCADQNSASQQRMVLPLCH